MRDPTRLQADEPIGSEFQSAGNSSKTFGLVASKQPSLNNALKRKLGVPKRSGDEAQLAQHGSIFQGLR